MKLWDNIKAKAFISGKIPISFYILQNTLNTSHKQTEIISEIQGKHLNMVSTDYLNPKYSIPLAFHKIFEKLIIFIETNNCNLDYKTKCVPADYTIGFGPKNKDSIKLPQTYTIDDMLAVDTYTIKDKIKVKKVIKIHEDMNKRKLIIANKSSFIGAFIDDGRLSLCGSDKAYILGNNLELILKILTFKISKIISNFLKYRMDFLDSQVYTYIPDIRKLGIDDISEDEFYILIGFTPQEINQIKNIIPTNEEADEEAVEEAVEEADEENMVQEDIVEPTVVYSAPVVTNKIKRKIKISVKNKTPPPPSRGGKKKSKKIYRKIHCKSKRKTRRKN